MKRYKTFAQFEKHLNELYFDCYTVDQAVDQFIYLTNKDRNGGHTTENNIRNCHAKRSLGTLLRKYDPTAFHSSYNNQ